MSTKATALTIARLIRTTNRGFGQCLQISVARMGYSSGMWHYLRVLSDGDGITQRELSQRAETVEPTVMKQLERMERAGLITRQRDEVDRRKIRIFLTQSGRDLFATLSVPAAAIPKAALDGVSQAEIDATADVLARIKSNLDAYYDGLIAEAPYSAARASE
jgi:DNA-binding MarR family transcriptional regulator